MLKTRDPHRIKVPASYRKYRRLVAIPESAFEAFEQYLDEREALVKLAEAKQNLRDGNYVVASSIDEAQEKFRAGALLNLSS